MSWHEVERHAQIVDSVLARARRIPLSEPPELQADLARYVTVLVSGYLEQSVKSIFGECIRVRAAPEVHRYAERRLTRIRNPNATDLAVLAGDFKAEWRTEVERLLSDPRKAAVDSVVANRHQIAHGRSVGIGLVEISNYYAEIQQVVRGLAEITGVLSR